MIYPLISTNSLVDWSHISYVHHIKATILNKNRCLEIQCCHRPLVFLVAECWESLKSKMKLDEHRKKCSCWYVLIIDSIDNYIYAILYILYYEGVWLRETVVPLAPHLSGRAFVTTCLRAITRGLHHCALPEWPTGNTICALVKRSPSTRSGLAPIWISLTLSWSSLPQSTLRSAFTCSFCSSSSLWTFLYPRITPTRRRRERRGRAQARFRWHLHRCGLRILTRSQLASIHNRLGGHHSKDPAFLRQLQVAMSNQSRAPWRCVWCKRLNKNHALTCGSCYTSWERCVDINYVHGSQNAKSPRRRQEQQWEDETWHAPTKKEKQANKTRKVTQSPRPRGSTPRGKKKQTQYGAPALDPPWKGTEVAPMQQQPPTGANSNAEQQLHELLAVLEASESPLSAEVQKVVEKSKLPQATAKNVRQALHHLEQKRKQLMAAQKARSNLHLSWNKYLEDSIKRWRTFAEDFATKDEVMEKKVTEIKAAMIEAKEKYDAAKSAMDKRDAEVLEAEEISDDMEEEVPERLASAEEIQTGIQSMLTTLEQGRVRPSEEEGDGQAAKKARLEGTAPALGSGALQPFGKPDK